MSLAGEHIPLSPFDTETTDDREAGIFSTISVPTSISRFEPASTSLAQSGTLPFLDGIIGHIAPDEISDGTSNSAGAAVPTSGFGGTIAGSSSVSSGIETLSSSTTVMQSITTTPPSKAGPSTIFTTISVSSTPGPLGSSATPALPEPEKMTNHSNIMLPSNKLFPLGIVVVILGGVVIFALAALLLCKFSKRRRQRRLGDRILSFSPDIGNAPYPFDPKAYDDDIESRYPAMSVGNTGSPPTLAPVVGIASSFPSQFETEVQGRFDNTVRGEYTQTTRAGPIHDRPDTFTCAMYPAGTCPIEHEISTNPPIVVERGGSPVPSFHTGRMDDQQPTVTVTSHQNHGRSLSGKLLTPSQPKYRSKHVPAPLMISPSINEGTNSVRGFTPRKSIISDGSAYTACRSGESSDGL